MTETKGQTIVGISSKGILVRVEGEDGTTSETHLSIDEAYALAGHIQTAAITLEQSAYVQQMQEKAEAQKMLTQMSRAGGKMWTP